MSYGDDIAHEGFSIVEEFLDSKDVSLILDALANATRTKAFGIRNLLNVAPFTRDLANNSACKSLIESILGPDARVVRGIYFDKHKDANWKVAWHQDLTIAVRERIDVEGYGPWSLKAGIHHVQPPVSVLEHMLTLRIHLDHTDESTAPSASSPARTSTAASTLLKSPTSNNTSNQSPAPSCAAAPS